MDPRKFPPNLNRDDGCFLLIPDLHDAECCNLCKYYRDGMGCINPLYDLSKERGKGVLEVLAKVKPTSICGEYELWLP